jgi:hypothetical protein
MKRFSSIISPPKNHTRYRLLRYIPQSWERATKIGKVYSYGRRSIVNVLNLSSFLDFFT